MRYEVYVGNIGCVYYGEDSIEAAKVFHHYAESSKAGLGRCGNEPVTLMGDGEIYFEYEPPCQENEGEQPSLRKHRVLLHIVTGGDGGTVLPPEDWNWHSLLDLGPDESVRVLDCAEIEEDCPDCKNARVPGEGDGTRCATCSSGELNDLERCGESGILEIEDVRFMKHVEDAMEAMQQTNAEAVQVPGNFVPQSATNRGILFKELSPEKGEPIFYVSNGDSLCPECYAIMTEEEREGYWPVFADGTGNDGHGLCCDCGAEKETFVLCRFCQKSTPLRTAHILDKGWVCDECWDERLW